MVSKAPRFRVQSPSICLLIFVMLDNFPIGKTSNNSFHFQKSVGFFQKITTAPPLMDFSSFKLPLSQQRLTFFLTPPQEPRGELLQELWLAALELETWLAWLLVPQQIGDQAVLFKGKLVSSSSCQSMIGAFLLHVVFKPILFTHRKINMEPENTPLEKEQYGRPPECSFQS